MSVEHRRPLYAFAVLVIVCGLFLGHAIRSEAFGGYFRALVIAAAPPAPATQVNIDAPEPVAAAVAPAAPNVPAVRRASMATHEQPSASHPAKHGKDGGTEARDRDRGPTDTTTDVPTDTTNTDTTDTGVTVPSVPPVTTVVTTPVITPVTDGPAKKSDRDSDRGAEKAGKAEMAGKDWAANRPDEATEKAATDAAKCVDRADRDADKAAAQSAAQAAKDLAKNAATAANESEQVAKAAAEAAEQAAKDAAKAAQDDLRSTGPESVKSSETVWVS